MKICVRERKSLKALNSSLGKHGVSLFIDRNGKYYYYYDFEKFYFTPLTCYVIDMYIIKTKNQENTNKQEIYGINTVKTIGQGTDQYSSEAKGIFEELKEKYEGG